MSEQIYYLLMKDRWNDEDLSLYNKLTNEQTPKTKPQKLQNYNIGDTKTDECGIWRKISDTAWELIA